MDKTKTNYIDLVRVIAIFAVILGHFHPFIGIDNVFGRKLIYMFHMPLFFIISGLLSKSSSFSKLFYSLIIPYIFYNLISFLRLDFYSVATIDAIKLDNSPTWFFAVLFIVKLIADKIKNIIHNSFVLYCS